MAIFDSNKKMYLTYYVALTDPDQVAAYQAQYPDGANIAPYNPGPPASGAAVQFNAPWRGYTQPAAGSAPFSWAPVSGEGEQDGPYPLNVATFTRHTGGLLGMGGTTVRYYWMGQFVLAADGDSAATGDGVPITATVPARHWIDGFEFPGFGNGTPSSATGCYISPDASRHTGGLGLALRGATSQYVCPTIGQGHATAAAAWHRFYIRLRKLPTAATFFWNTSNSVSPSQGTLLAITATGEIAIYTSNTTGVKTLVATIPDITLEEWDGTAEHDAWVRIDMLNKMAAVGPPSFRTYINGELKSTAGATNGGVGNITSTKFGPSDSVDNGLYLDVDDAMQSDIPTKIGDPLTEDLGSRDFLAGSKIVAVHPTGFSTNHSVNWTGDVRALRQNPGGTAVSTPAAITSSTSGAIAAVDTDAALTIDADAGGIGCAAIAVLLDGQYAGAHANGSLGYSLAGAAAVMTAVTEGTTATASVVLYGGPAVASASLPDVTPLELRYSKGADGVAHTMYMLQAMAELIGKWNRCDYRAAEIADLPDAPAPSSTGPHNYPYPRSPWSIGGKAAPISPYIVKGGTYVGNGTGQDLTFRAPVHTLMIRPVTGNTGGYWMLSTNLGAHRNQQEGVTAQIALEEDPTFNGAPGEDSQTLQYRARIAGNNAQLNAVGVTYQYIAIMDPGMRYSLGIALSHNTGFAARTWPLINPDFTPEAAILQLENVGSTTTGRLYMKVEGGNTAAGIYNFAAAAEVTPALTFGDGQVITDTALHAIVPFNQAMMLWRRSDGSQDTGEAGVVNFGSYIGDGSASRTVNLAPASGRRPLFAIVMGSSGTNRWRDPSHTSTNSSAPTGTEAATGITSGGIDSFSVGSGLNTNGVTYTYFVLFADATAGNNGWGVNGEYAPVEPTSPVDGPWPPDPPEPGTTPTPPTPPPTETDPDDPTPDFGVACVGATTTLVNRALSRIGISKQVSNVSTDNSVEAATARLHWGGDVNQVLRDYPWSFATRYADLVLVAGTSSVPANKDWQYSYRAPADMLFARRLVGQAGQKRNWDVDPIKFRLGSDATGALVYTDAVVDGTTPVQLEYTIRVGCPATKGDPIFRSALAWRHAMSLAPALTRDPKKVELCELMYQRTIAEAKRADAQEQQQAPEGDAPWITGRA